MTKATNKRTRPLDRDGDGHDGGSLPGNQTAPMIEDAAAATLPAGLTPAVEDAANPGPTIRDTGILASAIAELVRAGNTGQEIMETYPDMTESDIETAVQWSVAEAQKADADPLAGADDETRAAVEGRLRPFTDEAAHAAADRGAASTQEPAPTMAEANAVADAEIATEAQPWARDDDAILLKLGEKWIETDPTQPAALTLDTVRGWTDLEAQSAEAWADAMNAPDMVTDPESGEWLRADLTVIETPDILTPFLFAPEPEADPTDTFTAAEIAAGKTPVVEQEGETITPAGDAAPPVSADDLVTVEADHSAMTPAVAVRLPDLRRLVDNRWLYKTRDGYSPSYSAPFVSHEDVAVWVKAGLAEDRPSAGREGGVFVTQKAQRLVSGRMAA